MTPSTYDAYDDEYEDDDEEEEYEDDDEEEEEEYDDVDDVGWYADSNPIRIKSSSLIIIIIAETRSQ